MPEFPWCYPMGLMSRGGKDERTTGGRRGCRNPRSPPRAPHWPARPRNRLGLIIRSQTDTIGVSQGIKKPRTVRFRLGHSVPKVIRAWLNPRYFVNTMENLLETMRRNWARFFRGLRMGTAMAPFLRS